MYRLLRYGVALSVALISLTASANLQDQLDALEPGALFELPSEPLSPLVIRVPGVSVSCAQGTVIDGAGQGNTVEILAEGVSFSGCEVGNWGQDLNELDAGVFVAREARGAVIENNRLQGPALGVWLDATPDGTVKGNVIRGEVSLRSQDRGNGIHLFNTTGALIEGNDVSQTRDGIYIETANNNEIRNNVMTDLRYGIHYMYSMRNLLEGNVTRGTRTGYALMQSQYPTVVNNRSENDENYGILMNFITNSNLTGHVVTGVSQGQPGGDMIHGGQA